MSTYLGYITDNNIYWWVKKEIANRKEQAMNNDNDRIITSKDLHKELNEERKRKGLNSVPAINPRGGGTSTIARRDKSWSSVPDFFGKLFKKK